MAGLLNTLRSGAGKINSLLYPGMLTGTDPQAAQAAASQAMMQMGAGLLGGANFGQAYGAGSVAGGNVLENLQREALLRQREQEKQSDLAFREWQKQQAEAAAERQRQRDQFDIKNANRDRMYRRFDKQDAAAQREIENKRADAYLRVAQANAGGRSSTPASQAEFEYFQSLTPDQQKQYLEFAQRKSAGAGGTGMNDRQRSGLEIQRAGVIQYVASLTKRPTEEVEQLLASGGPSAVADLIRKEGKRTFQGSSARVLRALPGGQVLLDAMNADLLAARTTGGAGTAMIQNPTGPIATPDFIVGEKQIPGSEYPLEVQAMMVENLLRQGASMSGQSQQELPDPLGLR